jgi:hypothetical protein
VDDGARRGRLRRHRDSRAPDLVAQRLSDTGRAHARELPQTRAGPPCRPLATARFRRPAIRAPGQRAEALALKVPPGPSRLRLTIGRCSYYGSRSSWLHAPNLIGRAPGS